MSENDPDYWYWDSTTEKVDGPHSIRALLLLVAAKVIRPDTLVATSGQSSWGKLCDSIDLSELYRPTKDKKLTKSIVETLVERGLSNDELRGFSSIDKDAAYLLCTVWDTDVELDLSGITSLTSNVAEMFKINPIDYLNLSGLTEISDETAWELSEFIGENLDLSGIKTLSFRSWCYFSDATADIDLGEAVGCPNWLDPAVQLRCNMILAEKGRR